jgi:hypothetical protein
MTTIERFFFDFCGGDVSDDNFRKTVSLSRGKFRTFWLQEHVQKKLRKFKEIPDTDKLYDMMDTDNSRSVTVDEMLNGLNGILKGLLSR